MAGDVDEILIHASPAVLSGYEFVVIQLFRVLRSVPVGKGPVVDGEIRQFAIDEGLHLFENLKPPLAEFDVMRRADSRFENKKVINRLFLYFRVAGVIETGNRHLLKVFGGIDGGDSLFLQLLPDEIQVEVGDLHLLVFEGDLEILALKLCERVLEFEVSVFTPRLAQPVALKAGEHQGFELVQRCLFLDLFI